MMDPIWMQSVPEKDRGQARKIFHARVRGLYLSRAGTPVEKNIRIDTSVTPAWLAMVPKTQFRPALLRFHLRLAALYASQKGSVSELSRMIGLHERALPSIAGPASTKVRVGAATARAIEAASGGVVTRYQLNPEAFGEA